MARRPVSYGDIEWTDPSTEWPIPDPEWPAPEGSHDGGGPTTAPAECIETALDTAGRWYPRIVGHRRDAVLLTFTDVFERYLAAELTAVDPAASDPTGGAHTQSELERW